MKEKTKLENVAGSLPITVGATILAAIGGTPFAALLPVLNSSIASRRHRERIEAALTDIEQTLRAHEDVIRDLSDSQYKLVSETIFTILQTMNDEKVEYLKNILRNSINENALSYSDAEIISRIIRDISPAEMAFLSQNQEVSRISFGSEDRSDVLCVEFGTSEDLIVGGLIANGLVVPCAPTLGEVGLFRFSGAVDKLLALLAEAGA